MHTLLQDVRYGLRMLAKNPASPASPFLRLHLESARTRNIFPTQSNPVTTLTRPESARTSGAEVAGAEARACLE